MRTRESVVMRTEDMNTASTNKPAEAFDIEYVPALIQYLRKHLLIEENELPQVQVLEGGVSNRTVLVEPLRRKSFVVKQALAKLRVASDWYSDPRRIHREALGLMYLETITPPGTITPLIFEDENEHIIAMEAVARGHRNWKVMLLAEGPEREHVYLFAEVLATMHRNSFQHAASFRELFGDATWFNSLRLEPYYEYSAVQVPEAQAFFTHLIAETRGKQLSLVHGDYSPKNVLINKEQFVLLDHEVAHFGDPAFDVGFSLTHFLSKANHCRERRGKFLLEARFYVTHYMQGIQVCEFGEDFESRACRHTLACLLARVAGRSPLEYLSETERAQQQQAVLSLVRKPPQFLLELIDKFGKEL